MITKDIVAEQIAAYVHHRISLDQLVDWAESAMMDGEFKDDESDPIRDVVSRLGVADVRAFGLTWEDCEELLGRLGYKAHIEIIAS